jgi:hypothetical protein
VEHAERIGQAFDGRFDLGDHPLLQALVHGPEQVGLVGEVVVEGAAGDARRFYDGLGRRVGEAPFREQRLGGADQGGAGDLGLLGFGGHSRPSCRPGP